MPTTDAYITEFIRSFGRVKQIAVRNTYILLTAEVQMFHGTSTYFLGTIPLNYSLSRFLVFRLKEMFKLCFAKNFRIT